ncbi:glutaredoxin [Bacillus aryabhattai]|uniref:Glutaredoxin n=1 Tax=Priestia aryabhattai TaxID=412384 RepID=A0A7W3NHT9_PRIAR|nr:MULTISPECIES: glutaredoxin family protein [Priestia]MBA9043237.1 glutaredoxin [Priestia aryabhattai]MEB4889028.1 glutaredoxin family protein [Priestia megaterium]
MLVEIYSSDECIYCVNLKEWLDNKNIQYKEKNVSNKKLLEDLKNLGGIGIPFTVIKNGDQTHKVAGLNYKKLQKYLEID